MVTIMMIKKLVMIKYLVILRNYYVYLRYQLKSKVTKKPIPTNDKANFIVSIASYPKRDPLLPAVFQALSEQTYPPKKYVLVLSEEDYPSRNIPEYLEKLESRGIEILWNRNNPYAVKKLVPVVEKYPDLAVVTLDDDIIYHKYVLQNLTDNEYAANNYVVGHVGKAMHRSKTDIKMFYRIAKEVDEKTPTEEVYLIGWGGIYYPPKSLDSKFMNKKQINEIVPGRGSDFWFWAAAISQGTKQACIGIPKKFKLGIPIPLNEKTKPKDMPDLNKLEERFQRTVDYFEIRAKLIDSLPDY